MDAETAARLELRRTLLAHYERLGFLTVPLRPWGKRPIYRGWQTQRRPLWDGMAPEVNVGIATGEPSGNLVVLDFDESEGPTRWLGLSTRELARHTMVVETRRGCHIYARHDKPLSHSPERGFSIQGTGNLVVAPPSIHGTGFEYRFLGRMDRIARLSDLCDPASLYERRQENKEAKSPRPCKPRDALREPQVAVPPIELEAVEAWIERQHPKLRFLWEALKRQPPAGFDRSGAEFAIACCLYEGGFSAEVAVAALRALPGSKACQREEKYTWNTVRNAFRTHAERLASRQGSQAISRGTAAAAR